MRLAARFALRNLRREWRSGELLTLVFALAIAVLCASAVGSFVDRIERALVASGAELIGGDLGISSRTELPDSFDTQARAQGLETTRLITFPSVLFAGETSVLADVRAAAPGYPLRGEVRISDAPFAESRPAGGLPAEGEAWADARVFAALQLQPGDSIDLGTRKLKLTRVLVAEPEGGGELFAFAPRLLVSLASLREAGLLGPGSRAAHRLLVAGDPSRVAAFAGSIAVPAREAGARLIRLEDTQRQLDSAFARARQFLGLATLLSILLAAAAIALAAQRFAERHMDSVAVLRAIGARQRFVASAFLIQLFALALPVAVLAALAGQLLQSLLVELLAAWFPAELPPAGWRAPLHALVSGCIVLIGFAAAPILALRSVPPARVLNRSLPPPRTREVLRYALPLLALAGVAVWMTGDLVLAMWVLGALSVVVVSLVGVALLTAALLRRWLRRVRHPGLRFGLANLMRRRKLAAMQLAALGTGICALLLLAVIGRDLLGQWRSSLAPDTPNFFALNIQPAQREGVLDWLQQNSARRASLAPIAVGRLVSINGTSPGEMRFADARAERWAGGTVNLSWMDTLPESNTLVAGRFWDPGETRPQLSISDNWAQVLELGLGDEVEIAIADARISAEITSIRKVRWDSFEVNFFLLLPPAAVGQVAHGHLASFHLDARAEQKLPELLREYPNLSLIDIDAILERVREVIARVSAATQWVLAFSVLSGLMVLFAALQATRDERALDSAVLRTLGASRNQIRSGVLAEFALLGGLAAGVAAMGALAAGMLLATRVFDIPYSVPWTWLPLASLAGAIGCAAAGWIGSRGAVGRSPMRVLRGT